MLYDDMRSANKWMEGRIKLFEKTRKSVLEQEGDFEWIISLDKRTPRRFVEAIITDERMKVVHCDIRDTFHEIDVDTPWVITSRLDNDDLYVPGTIKAIQACFTAQEIIIDLRYRQKRGNTLYTSGPNGTERRAPNSPFLSLIEKTDHRIRTAFARPHALMIEEYKGIWASREPLAYQVVHGSNAANKIVGTKVN
jgi:hypothetical protein